MMLPISRPSVELVWNRLFRVPVYLSILYRGVFANMFIKSMRSLLELLVREAVGNLSFESGLYASSKIFCGILSSS